jgi:hypothetical protein
MRVLCGGYVPLDEDGLPFVPVTEHCAAWPTSWTRRSWMRSRVRPGRSWAGCCPTWPGAWSGQAAAGAAVAGAGQEWLFERLLGVVQQLAATAPLLLIVEDLHWATAPPRPARLDGQQAVQVDDQVRAGHDLALVAVRLGQVGLSAIGDHPLSLSRIGSVGARAAVELVAVGPPACSSARRWARSGRRAMVTTRRWGVSRLSTLSSATVR